MDTLVLVYAFVFVLVLMAAIALYHAGEHRRTNRRINAVLTRLSEREEARRDR